MRVLAVLTLVSVAATALGVNIPPEIMRQKNIVNGAEQPVSKHEKTISKHEKTISKHERTVISKAAPIEARLMGGSTSSEGYVEVLYLDYWGRICDDLWDINDATVVCRQLGFESAIEAAIQSRFYNGTNDDFLMDDVACTGAEENIGDCVFNGWFVENCASTEVAGVVCAEPGTSFAVAFSPVPRGDVDGDCAIILLAQQATSFTIRGITSRTDGLIAAGDKYRYNVPCSDRTTNNIERKVYYITTDRVVSVVAVNNPNSDQNNMDATAVYPIIASSTEFYLVAFTNQAGNTNGCSASDTSTFLTVAATEDGTRVQFYSHPNYQPEFFVTLQRFDVFTQTYDGVTQFDFTGWYVVADKPVSITTGNVCAQAAYPTTSNNDPGFIWTFIPPVAALDSGTHVAFDIYNPGSTAEYYSQIVVLATQNGTSVAAGGSQYLLNRGDHINLQDSNVPLTIECGDVCFVVQVNNNYNDNTGIFFVHVPSASTYVDDATFTALPTYSGTYTTQYVRIFTRSPTSDLNIEGLQEAQGWSCDDGYGCDYLGSFQGPGSPPGRVFATVGTGANFTAIVYMSDSAGEGFGYNVHVPVKDPFRGEAK